MEELLLLPGPRLVQRAVGDEAEPVVREAEVTARAAEFLFEPVRLDARVTLADVLGLLDASPVLLTVFRREFAEEIMVEVRKGALVSPPGLDPPEVVGIDWLELYWSWTLDSSSGTFGQTHRLQLHGIGKVLEVDAPGYGAKAGDRITWGVDLMSVRELLALPVRVSEDLAVVEDDVDSSSFGDRIQEARLKTVTLGQVLHGLLYELSFHGGPRERSAFAAELVSLKRQVDEGVAELVWVDDLLAEADVAASLEAMFDDLGGITGRDVVRSMRKMEDDQMAGDWFDDEFAGAVVVKAQFRDRCGRDFRKLFRAAGR